MTQAISLQKLLAPFVTVSATLPDEIFLSSLSLDSRQIGERDLFVAVQGAQLDGRLYIEKAIHLGASAVLSETINSTEHGNIGFVSGIPVITFYQLGLQLSHIAQRFYFSDSNLHKVVAITGTNGKTTIATLLANAITLLGKQSAQMGTIGNGLFGHLQESLNTTLDAISVFSQLRDYQNKGCHYTMMEVSSHGLIQKRVSAVPFYSAIFTNLTRDHLDYHGNMENYGLAKKILFKEFPIKHRIINADDDVGLKWLAEFPQAVGYGFTQSKDVKNQRYLKIKKVDYHASGVDFFFTSSWGNGQLSAPFYGDFNVSNLAAVVAQLLIDGFEIPRIESIFPKLKTVAGRMEQTVFKDKKITFVVDYAHTPDALKKALQALQQHKSEGRLICVFGCGGDRDRGKRPEMASIAEKQADKVVLVDDNPRTESASDIMQDILKGFNFPEKVVKIHDREQAIVTLLENCKPGDLVLLAGKGHEDYQIFGTEKVNYSDRAVLKALKKSELKDRYYEEEEGK